MATETLFVCRSAPGADDAPRELLEMAMTAAIFAVPVTLLFLGEGVQQLRIEDADTGPDALASLPLSLKADAQAMEQYGLNGPKTLELLDAGELRALFHEAGKVVMY